jgi:hypothetical protein
MRGKAYPKPLLTNRKTEVQKTASSIVTGENYARTLYVNDHSKIKICMFGLVLLLEWPMLQSNLSYVTFQENVEIWSHNAGHKSWDLN